MWVFAIIPWEVSKGYNQRKDINTIMYSKQSHTTWDCNYHIVVVPKHRKSKLFQTVRKEIREIIQELCKRYEIELVRWNVSIDHFHMLIKIAPKHSVSSMIWILKWKSAIMLNNRHWKKKMLWQKNFWIIWYFVSTAWIDLKSVKKYIENQNRKDILEEWKQLDFNW